MVFENVTALELHVHTDEESEESEDRPVRTVVRPGPKSKRNTIAIAAVMGVVSLTLSIGITLLFRWVMGGDDS